MKRITFIALHLGFGGIEKSIANVANMLCNDYEIKVISIYKLYDKPVFEFDKKIKIEYLIDTDLPIKLNKYRKIVSELNILGFFKNIWIEYISKFKFISLFKDFIKGSYIMKISRKNKLKEYLQNDTSDIYFTTHPFMNKILNENTDSYKVAWEHNHHNGNKKYIKRFRKSTKYVNDVIVVSKSLSDFYKKDFAKNNIQTKVHYITNFIDETPAKLSKLDTDNLLYVGRLSPEKGVLDLIDVIKLAIKKNPNLLLNIVGDGDQYDLIKNKIIENNLHKNIKLCGFLHKDKINEILEKTSIFLLASHTESFGIVLLEAMQFGVPCISFSTAEGANDLIENNVNGYIIKNRSNKAMANKIDELLCNRDKLKDMGKKAFNSTKNYTISKNKLEWERFMKKIKR